MRNGSLLTVCAETFCNVRMSAVKYFYKVNYYYKITAGLLSDMSMEEYKRLYSSTNPQRLPFVSMFIRAMKKELLLEDSAQSLITWGCAFLGFFFLCRAGEVWGPSKKKDSDHLLLWKNKRMDMDLKGSESLMITPSGSKSILPP